MKKTRIISILWLFIFWISLFSFHAFSEETTVVYLDGKELQFDVPAQIIQDRAMVPMRKIFESLGANVTWNEEYQSISATKNDINITLQIGNLTMIKEIKVNGWPSTKLIDLDVAPIIINDRTLVPIRAVSEALGADVKWDENTKTVSITSLADNSKDEVNLHPIYRLTKDNFKQEFYFDRIINSHYLDDFIVNPIPKSGQFYTDMRYLKDGGTNVLFEYSCDGSIDPEEVYNHYYNVMEQVFGKPSLIVDSDSSKEIPKGALWDGILLAKKTDGLSYVIGIVFTCFENTDKRPSGANIAWNYGLINDYLDEKYSKLSTPVGEFEFSPTVGINSGKNYIDISVNYSRIEMDRLSSPNYSQKAREESENLIKDYMERLGKEVISLFPSQKVCGKFHTTSRSYPSWFPASLYHSSAGTGIAKHKYYSLYHWSNFGSNDMDATGKIGDFQFLDTETDEDTNNKNIDEPLITNEDKISDIKYDEVCIEENDISTTIKKVFQKDGAICVEVDFAVLNGKTGYPNTLNSYIVANGENIPFSVTFETIKERELNIRNIAEKIFGDYTVTYTYIFEEKDACDYIDFYLEPDIILFNKGEGILFEDLKVINID